jgi:hypothetical protein
MPETRAQEPHPEAVTVWIQAWRSTAASCASRKARTAAAAGDRIALDSATGFRTAGELGDAFRIEVERMVEEAAHRRIRAHRLGREGVKRIQADEGRALEPGAPDQRGQIAQVAEAPVFVGAEAVEVRRDAKPDALAQAIFDARAVRGDDVAKLPQLGGAAVLGRADRDRVTARRKLGQLQLAGCTDARLASGRPATTTRSDFTRSGSTFASARSAGR